MQIVLPYNRCLCWVILRQMHTTSWLSYHMLIRKGLALPVTHTEVNGQCLHPASLKSLLVLYGPTREWYSMSRDQMLIIIIHGTLDFIVNHGPRNGPSQKTLTRGLI